MLLVFGTFSRLSIRSHIHVFTSRSYLSRRFLCGRNPRSLTSQQLQPARLLHAQSSSHTQPTAVDLRQPHYKMDSKITVPVSDTDSLEIPVAPIVKIAKEAGDVIMTIYNSPTDDWALQTKSDDSPLTKADLSANNHICTSLTALFAAIPIMSEETKAADFSVRQGWHSYWCVDPLDGTKEFIKRNGEFTVNIALMLVDRDSDLKSARPVLGVVFAPALGRCFFAAKGCGAFEEREAAITPMSVRQFSESDDGLILVCSRSHLDERTKAFLALFNNASTKSMGSSLKFMLVAGGEAHIYPRIAPTMEWDTAASQIVVEEAGGEVLNADTGKPVVYNKDELRNPYFYVYGKRLLQ